MAEYKRRSLGKQIIQSALEKMHNHGHSACLLRTENPKNVGLYEHLGFKQIHTDTPHASKLPYTLVAIAGINMNCVLLPRTQLKNSFVNS